MRTFLAVIVVCGGFASPALADDVCLVGITKASVGEAPFSWVGSPKVRAKMPCTEAKNIAEALNERHNNNKNGLEAVEAKVYRGLR